MNKPIVFGITGNLGTGKSSLALALQSYWARQNRTLRIIEIDDVRRYALWKSVQPHHIQLRKDLAKKLNLFTRTECHWLDRTIFTELIFSSKENLNQYSEIATPFFMHDVQTAISKEKSDTAIVWSLLLEEKYNQLLTHPIIITECSFKTVLDRLSPSIKKGDDLSYEELQQRISLENKIDSKINFAKEKEIEILKVNTETPINDNVLEQLFSSLQKENNSILNNNMNLHPYDTNLDFCKFKIPQASGRVIWEITNECNYACSYCIFASTGRKPEGELTTEEVFSALSQLKKEGFSHIKFTGGEPFLREDMIDILKMTNDLGFQFDISTNASRITEEVAYELSKLNAEFIHVSLDGHDLSSHESVRGKKTFIPTIKGLKILCDKGLKIRVGCVIHSDNQDNLPEIVKFCSAINVRHVVFSMMEPVGRLRDKTKGLATKPLQELAETLDKLKKNYPYMLISHNLQSMQKVSVDSIKSVKKTINPVAPCPAGERFLSINCLGAVSPCPWVSEHRPQYVGSKINKEFLADILSSAPIQSMKKISKNLVDIGKPICPMSDLSTTTAIEIALKASAIENHKDKFGEFAPIYRFTTENLEYLTMLDVKDKKVLTIGGSYDHAIDLALLGAKAVENIDVNLCAKYYAQLKRVALLHLDYDDFKSFFGDSPKALDFDVYCSLKAFLPLDCEVFFNNLYLGFEKIGKKLVNSNYFHNRVTQNFLNHSAYLINESNYLKARENIKNHKFHWHQQSILNQNNIDKFDIVLLSNIADYSHKIFDGENHVEQFREKVVLPWLSHLTTNGKIMFAYVFDSQNILGSDKRNQFNDKEVRKSIYGDLLGYTLREITIKSSIKNAITDTVCILERK